MGTRRGILVAALSGILALLCSALRRPAQAQDAGPPPNPGMTEFVRHCASCHWDYRAPGCAAHDAPSLLSGRSHPVTEARLRAVVRRGLRRAGQGCSMPAFASAQLSDAELADLARLLRAYHAVR